MEESFNSVQTLDELLALFTRCSFQFSHDTVIFCLYINLFKQCSDSFCTSLGYERARTMFSSQITEFVFTQDLLISKSCITWICNNPADEIYNFFQLLWWDVEQQRHSGWNTS